MSSLDNVGCPTGVRTTTAVHIFQDVLVRVSYTIRKFIKEDFAGCRGIMSNNSNVHKFHLPSSYVSFVQVRFLIIV